VTVAFSFLSDRSSGVTAHLAARLAVQLAAPLMVQLAGRWAAELGADRWRINPEQSFRFPADKLAFVLVAHLGTHK
jgi:hypothetical protein